MRAPVNPGRVAGFWYLLLVVIGPLRLIYIPSKLFVHGNAAATANNIAAHELLFRLGIIADLAGAVILVMLTLAFYRLFAGVDRTLAVQVLHSGMEERRFYAPRKDESKSPFHTAIGQSAAKRSAKECLFLQDRQSIVRAALHGGLTDV